MSTSTLPTSRFDAMSVFTISLASALLGATPGESKCIALLSTTLGNVWAIFTAVVTFKELLGEVTLETHLRLFVMVLLVLTIISSSLTLLSFVLRKRVDRLVILGGLITPLVALLFGLGALCFAFFHGCKSSESAAFARSQYCAHSTNVVVLVLVGAVVATLLVGWFVFWMVDKYGHSSAGTLPTACIQCADRTKSRRSKTGDLEAPTEYRYLRDALAENESPQPHSPGSAMVTRLSALAKACLLGVYWFLVDGELSREAFTFEQYDVTSWASGQYAKQGAAIANNIFNCLPC